MLNKKHFSNLGHVACVTLAIFLTHSGSAWSDDRDAKSYYQQGKFTEAFEIWSKESDNGDPEAQFNLATLYEAGRGVDKDTVKAKLLLEQSADKNYAPALHNLALLHFEEDKPEEALGYLEKAVLQKFVASYYTLGKFHQFGILGETKPELAFHYIELAATEGHMQAQYNLGKMYRDGYGIDANAMASTRWFLRSAFQGNKKAQAKVADRFATGTGVSKNVLRALTWTFIADANRSQALLDLQDELLKILTKKEIEKAKTDAKNFEIRRENDGNE